MFYVASKFVQFFLLPSTLIFSALSVGIAFAFGTKRRRQGLRIALAALALLSIAGFSTLSSAMLLPLENRFQSKSDSAFAGGIDGVIILGGFEDGRIDGNRDGISLNQAGERLIEGLRLARSIPSAKVVFTTNVANADDSEKFFRKLRSFMIAEGISADRIMMDDHARNTFENARYAFEMLRPTHQQTWILVTSAFHMPRAIGTFRRYGFNVIAYPVDFRTRGIDDVMRVNRLGAGLESFDLAVREWVGLFAYWITGRSDALLPAQ